MSDEITAIELISLERDRQINSHGYNAEHDQAENPNHELAQAASTYLNVAINEMTGSPIDAKMFAQMWPNSWPKSSYKPESKMRNLIRAAALIAAEIDKSIANGELIY